MAVKSLAIKYRPKTFDDVTEQCSIKTILEYQIKSGTVKNGYLFCGGAGTGKTTCARIFANEINGGVGEPIELDAASNNSVDDIRRLCEQAQTKSMDSEYKIFIIDECHSLSNQAWQAALKTLEEPPAKSIFIFCTTDPQKIPKTILSRVQRYNFQRISLQGIIDRLFYILEQEEPDVEGLDWEATAVEYLAKLADGGMRDAITLMDKCLSFSPKLTVDNVVKALGVVNYDDMLDLNDMLITGDHAGVIKFISDVHSSGRDLKLFAKDYFEFVLDICIFLEQKSLQYTKIPTVYSDKLKKYTVAEANVLQSLLTNLVNLNTSIKWEQNPKAVIIANLILFMNEVAR